MVDMLAAQEVVTELLSGQNLIRADTASDLKHTKPIQPLGKLLISRVLLAVKNEKVVITSVFIVEGLKV